MKYYSFNFEGVKYYTGERSPQVDPRESAIKNTKVFVLPGRNETKVSPPSYEKNEIPVWNGKEWDIVPDHRGEIWYTSEGDGIIVKEIGIPKGLFKEQPEQPVTKYDVNNERNLRIMESFVYNGHKIQLDLDSKSRLQMNYLKALKDDNLLFEWFDADNNIMKLDSAEFMAMVDAATEFETGMILKAKKIKKRRRISKDYQEDKYWK